jgi:hypothetical protein
MGVGYLVASWPPDQDLDLHHLATQLQHLEYKYSLLFNDALIC